MYNTLSFEQKMYRFLMSEDGTDSLFTLDPDDIRSDEEDEDDWNADDDSWDNQDL